MLRLSNLPDELVSGISSEELEWVTRESNDRFLEELSEEFARKIQSEEILDIPNEVIEELKQIERNGIPESSARQMEDNVRRFKAFLEENKLSSDLMSVPKSILCNYIRFFYSTLRTKDNLFYAPASLICIRAGLHRFFCLNRPDINIIADQAFAGANRMLVSMVQRYKQANQPKARDQFAVIEKADLLKIMDYFDRSNGVVLQQEVMFHLIYYFGLRGRETLPTLTKASFVFLVDSDGRDYVALNHDLLSKNSKASLKQTEFHDAKQARMYSDSVNRNCPVSALRKYLQCLEELNIDSLFPKPCLNSSKGLLEKRWYFATRTLGKNSIDQLMSQLSADLGLSKRYTNHCIRVTHVTVLKEHGFSNAAIASNTGHKNPESVDRYSRMRRDVDFRTMSEALSVETTSSSVSFQRVGGTGVISIKESSTTNQTLQTGGQVKEAAPLPTVSVNISGTFNNCKFKFSGFQG